MTAKMRLRDSGRPHLAHESRKPASHGRAQELIEY